MPKNWDSKIGLWGIGREGQSFLKFLSRANIDTEVLIFNDQELVDDTKQKCLSLYANCKFIAPNDAPQALTTIKYLVRSPGFSVYRDEVKKFMTDGGVTETSTSIAIGLLGPDKCIGITGTKGKTTTAAMLNHVLVGCGRNVVLAGNVGKPLIDFVGVSTADQIFVVELSSYQIADLQNFPALRVITNLFQEHLDWHHGVENYFRDKTRLATVPVSGISFINAGDAHSVARLAALTNIKFYNAKNSVHYQDGKFFNADSQPTSIPTLSAMGDHICINACAAISCALALGEEWGVVTQALNSFENLPHRLQIIGVEGGVTYVNDSIATIPEATIAALERFSKQRVQLILGGFDRGVDYSGLLRVLPDYNIGSIAFIGPAGVRMQKELDATRLILMRLCADLGEAVQYLKTQSKAGDVILLSPAATSYDQFTNFEERGKAFQALMLA